MADILHTFCVPFFEEKMLSIEIQRLLKFFSKHQIENEWPLIQVFARCRTDTKHSPTLPDPMH